MQDIIRGLRLLGDEGLEEEESLSDEAPLNSV